MEKLEDDMLKQVMGGWTGALALLWQPDCFAAPLA